MHPYSTDSRRRITIPLIIGGFSLLLVQNVEILYELFPRVWILESWVPSFGLITTLLYYAFSRWLWRLSTFRVLGIVNVPDLNGEWNGTGKTFRHDDDQEEEFYTTVTIRHHWTKMSIRLETDDSISHSKGGVLLTEDSVNPTLTYHYLNQPKPQTPETMHTHRGTASLEYSRESGRLSGRYYTNEERRRYGDIELEREEKPSMIKRMYSGFI